MVANPQPRIIIPGEKDLKNEVFVPNALFDDDGDVTEIVTQINVPTDGGWGWVVVVSSFTTLFILDGNFLSFGVLFPDLRNDLKVDDYLVALINSVAITMYFLMGPIASAVINRYGFRECAMIGSVISSLSLLGAYFSTTYTSVFLCYGLFKGIGASLIGLSSCLVVGFYFERLRSLAFAITTSGSSTGNMCMAILNNYLVQLAGWRITTLFHTGMFAFMYFLGMTYKPLLPLFVTKTTDKKTVVTTNLPSVVNVHSESQTTEGGTATERLFQAVSNIHFPTAAKVVQQEVPAVGTKPGTSEAAAPEYTLSTIGPSGISQRQLTQVQSLIDRSDRVQSKITLDIKPPKKRSICAKIFHWKKNAAEARPLYRDDIFYQSKINILPEYKKSVVISSQDRFPIEYHLAVTRAATADDIAGTRHLFPTSMRRVLATMIDLALLRKYSFLLICISAFFNYMGVQIPFVFMLDRNVQEGMDPDDCGRILSFIGLTSTVGRLLMALLVNKISPLVLYVISIFLTALASIALNYSFDLYYQYTCAGIFGFFQAGIYLLRTLVLVELYGLENLTNATGVNLLFQGVACLISSPIAGLINVNYGFDVSFYLAGIYLLVCGLTMIPINAFARKEALADAAKQRELILRQESRRSSLNKQPKRLSYGKK